MPCPETPAQTAPPAAGRAALRPLCEIPARLPIWGLTTGGGNHQSRRVASGFSNGNLTNVSPVRLVSDGNAMSSSFLQGVSFFALVVVVGDGQFRPRFGVL